MTWIRLALMYFFMVAQKLHAKSFKGLLEVYGNMVEVLLVLEMFLAKDS